MLLAPSRFVVCTSDLLLWTTTSFEYGDGIVIEECVRACSIPFSALLGATMDRRSIVKIWVNEGPTLKLQATRRDDAAELFACVDRASAEATA